MKKKPFKWKCPIYEITVLFFVGWDFRDFGQYSAENFHAVPDCHDVAGCVAEINHEVILWTDPIATHPQIAHECLHACNTILGNIGQKASYRNDEVQTYLFEEVYAVALTQLKRPSKRKKA